MVRVGGDGELRALGPGGADQCAVEVQALRAGIDLQPDAAARGLRRDAVEIERERVALQQDAAGGVSHDAQVGALQRAQQAVGHLARLLVHVAVHAADHQVERGQRVVGQIHRAVLEDVALDATEDADAQADAVDLAHAAGKLHHALFIQAVGHGKGLGVVGDGDVFVAALARRLGHFFQRGAAISLGGVHVQVAADVAQFHQLGKASLLRGFDFAGVLAQFGRDPRQAQRLVDAFLGLAGHAGIARHAEQAVLAQLQPHLHGARANGDVVVLAAREVLHGGAEVLRQQRAHVHLQAFAAHFGAGLIPAAPQPLPHPRVGDKLVERVGGRGARHQQIEIAHRLAPAPQAARRGHGIHARHPAQEFAKFFGHAFGIAQQIASGALAIPGDGAQYLLLQLGAHAGQRAQLLLLAEALQFVGGRDVEVLEDERDTLGAKALDLEEFQSGGREFCEQQVAALAGTAFGDFGEHHGEALADSRNVGDLALRVAQDIGDAFRVAFHGGSAVAIAANAKRIFGGDLHQIGGFPQHARDFLVLQTGFLHPIVSGRVGPFGRAARRFYMQQRRLVFSVVVLTFLAAPAAWAQSTPFTVVNAASYGSALAPDSVATIFGSNLAPGTASATLDANGQLPTVLASASVEINGVLAPLFYVAPGQINLVVPGGLTAGTATVLIRSTTSGSTQSGTALGRAAAPGVFTSDASGGGAGAILNAVTYQPAPFMVQTGDSGSDTRTRIAVYGTGLRHADAVTALAQDPAGNRYSLTVEYAGAAPGLFGLDQVNLLLPPDLDGAGTVSLSLVADSNAANVVTFQMNLLAASALRMATLTLSAVFVSAGDSTTLTVGLNGVARAGGFVVGLRSDNAAAQVASQITILEGKASAQTTVATSAVSATQAVTITAQAGAMAQSVPLEIDPASSVQLAALSTSVASILGGRSLTGTVTLTGNSPGNVNISLASDNDHARPPASVTVPFTRSSADFAIATLAVTDRKSVV